MIDEYGNPIFRYCFRMLKSKQEAEDAVQEIFIRAYKALCKKAVITFEGPWLYRIAYNHCLNIIRRRKLIEFTNLSEELTYKAIPPGDELVENTLSEELCDALSLLSAEQRTVIILRVIEEMDYDEIGVILNKNSGNIRKIHERAKKKLQSNWNVKREVVINEGNSIL